MTSPTRKDDASPITPGPRKQDLKRRVSKPRLSSHKRRSVWFRARSAWPYREAPVHSLVLERNRVKRDLPTAKDAAPWRCIGPTNIGGRMTSLVCHPENADRIWAGAAGGGVWQSDNAGVTWRTRWNKQDSLNIGALAIDPANPDVIYCGTGEANLSADSYGGVGIYKTTDGGRTWQLLARASDLRIPTRIGVIAINPFDSAHLLIAGVGADESSPREEDFGGMFVSHNGGVTWQRETFISTNNYWCHAIVFHPKKGVIFATFTEQGAKNGIWLSEDGGEHWRQLSKDLPHSENFGRTSLAISPSDPDVIYAFAQNTLSDRSDLVLGVFRSANRGEAWKEIGRRHFGAEGQISYGNTIAVHPKHPNHVLCGGVDLHLTTDGRTTWTRATRWNTDRGSIHYAHADHHHLLMPLAHPGRVYDPNDGGLDVSDDGGLTWKNRSKGLAVTMYYDMDVAQSDGGCFGGGAQDNGTLVTTAGRSNDHHEVLDGDGGWMIYDPGDATHFYASCYNMGIYRWRNGRKRNVSPPAGQDETDSVWMVYVTMDPQDPDTVFTGSTRVWRTKNDGKKWRPVSPDLDGSTISAIEVAPADSQRIYVGTENGGFFRSVDGGNRWSANLASAALPGHTITRIDSTAKLGADFLFVTVANFGHSHVFCSRDGGKTWEDADKGQLPDVPHHAVVIRPDHPETVYVGNDAGVFVSHDSGVTWENMSRNLPNVSIVDLVLQEKGGTLSAATYGR